MFYQYILNSKFLEDDSILHPINVLSMWTVDGLKKFCEQFEFSTNEKRKEELISLAHSAQVVRLALQSGLKRNQLQTQDQNSFNDFK